MCEYVVKKVYRDRMGREVIVEYKADFIRMTFEGESEVFDYTYLEDIEAELKSADYELVKFVKVRCE